jgi:hypothetical protein
MGDIWVCKIGEANELPKAADGPMRKAVTKAYEELTGNEPDFVFSGWGGELTEYERAAHEDRMPIEENVEARGTTEFNDLISIQGRDGNWNYSSYMRGLYNGMELMMAVIERRDPRFKDVPEKYLSEESLMPNPPEPTGPREPRLPPHEPPNLPPREPPNLPRPGR